MQYGFCFDMRSCSECRTCVIACKDKNDLKVGINYRDVIIHEGGVFPKPWVYFMSMACNHCKEPICVAKCPTGAMYKREEDGIVLIDEERCIGCKSCTKACPYMAPKYMKDKKKSVKCDMCIDMLTKGEKPVCVTACMSRALDFGDIKELELKYGKGDEIKSLPPTKKTKPSLVILAKECAK